MLWQYYTKGWVFVMISKFSWHSFFYNRLLSFQSIFQTWYHKHIPYPQFDNIWFHYRCILNCCVEWDWYFSLVSTINNSLIYGLLDPKMAFNTTYSYVVPKPYLPNGIVILYFIYLWVPENRWNPGRTTFVCYTSTRKTNEISR